MTKVNSILKDFTDAGFVDLGGAIDEEWCSHLYSRLRSKRYFGPEIFYNERDYHESQKNIGPRGKILDILEGEDVGLVEDSPLLKEIFTRVLKNMISKLKITT